MCVLNFWQDIGGGTHVHTAHEKAAEAKQLFESGQLDAFTAEGCSISTRSCLEQTTHDFEFHKFRGGTLVTKYVSNLLVDICNSAPIPTHYREMPEPGSYGKNASMQTHVDNWVLLLSSAQEFEQGEILRILVFCAQGLSCEEWECQNPAYLFKNSGPPPSVRHVKMQTPGGRFMMAEEGVSAMTTSSHDQYERSAWVLRRLVKSALELLMPELAARSDESSQRNCTPYSKQEKNIVQLVNVLIHEHSTYDISAESSAADLILAAEQMQWLKIVQRCLDKAQRDCLARPQLASAHSPHHFADQRKVIEDEKRDTQNSVLAFAMSTHMRLGALSEMTVPVFVFEDQPLKPSPLQMGNMYRIVQIIGQHLLAEVKLAPATTILKTPQWKKHRRVRHILEEQESIHIRKSSQKGKVGKMITFACGQHVRLGATSIIYPLSGDAIKIIGKLVLAPLIMGKKIA